MIETGRMTGLWELIAGEGRRETLHITIELPSTPATRDRLRMRLGQTIEFRIPGAYAQTDRKEKTT
jgi:hypothetical protein